MQIIVAVVRFHVLLHQQEFCEDVSPFFLLIPYCSRQVYSQIKRQKLRVSVCTEEVLGWFNYSCASDHLRCKVSCRGYRIDLHCHFTCTLSRQEGKLNLTRKQTDLWPRCWKASATFIDCSTWISCCKQQMLWMRLWMGVCTRVRNSAGKCCGFWTSSEAHQIIEAMYMRSVDLLSIYYTTWWAFTGRTSKSPHSCQNWRAGAYMKISTCPGQYGISLLELP